MDKNEYQRSWRKNNPNKVKYYNKKYHKKGTYRKNDPVKAKERIIEMKNKQLKWIEENKLSFSNDYIQPVINVDNSIKRQLKRAKHQLDYQKRKEYLIRKNIENQNKKRENDPSYITLVAARNAISTSIKKGLNSPSYFKSVGYTKEEMIAHLYSTIPESYSWQHYLDKVLVLDHLIPVHLYHFKSYQDEEFRKCFALKNLHLCTSRLNCLKSKDVYVSLIAQYDLYDILPKGWMK